VASVHLTALSVPHYVASNDKLRVNTEVGGGGLEGSGCRLTELKTTAESLKIVSQWRFEPDISRK
jgi:hypothetical protein